MVIRFGECLLVVTNQDLHRYIISFTILLPILLLLCTIQHICMINTNRCVICCLFAFVFCLNLFALKFPSHIGWFVKSHIKLNLIEENICNYSRIEFDNQSFKPVDFVDRIRWLLKETPRTSCQCWLWSLKTLILVLRCQLLHLTSFTR